MKLLLVITITSLLLLSACKVDPLYFPASNPAPNNQPKLFGYYACAMEGVGTGNYIAEIKDHGNLVYIQSGDVQAKLNDAQTNGLYALFSFTNLLFDSQWRLRSNWQDSVNSVKNLIHQYDTTVAAFYIIDEPYGRAAQTGVEPGEMFDAMNKVGEYLKMKFPDKPIAVIFSAPELIAGVNIPRSFDWFGVDCYTRFERCDGVSIPDMYDILDKGIRQLDARDGKRRQLMVIPPSGYDGNIPGDELNHINQISQYREWLKYRNDIHIIVAFIWQGVHNQADNWYGTRDSPALFTAYTKFYQDFIEGGL
jgi:hypothetical protein